MLLCALYVSSPDVSQQASLRPKGERATIISPDLFIFIYRGPSLPMYSDAALSRTAHGNRRSRVPGCNSYVFEMLS